MSKTIRLCAIFLLSAATCWGQNAFQPVTLATRNATVADGATRFTSPLTLTVPADTEASIELLSGLHTRVSHVDDPVEARLLSPVFVNGRVALPSGTLIAGRITQIQAAGHMHRPAELAFRFDQISLPDGQIAPITAILAAPRTPQLRDVRIDDEGNLRGTRGFSWKGIAGGLAAVGSFATLKAAAAGAASLAYIVPAGGAAFLGYELLLPRGNEVHVPPETQFRIRLSIPVTVRVHG